LTDNIFRLLMSLYRVVFARRCFYTINRLLFNLSLRGMGILNDEGRNWTYTGEERFLRRVASTWRTPPTVLDVGAHVGEYANIVKRLAPQARVYAFEPHPKTFAELTRQADRHGYSAWNVGCGDRTQTVSLYDYEAAQGSVHASLYQEVISTLHRGRPIATDVQVIALDDFIEEHKLTKVQLLKIDTEGHELRVLMGLKKSLPLGVVDVIQFEFNAMNVISRVFLRDFSTLLPDYSFYRLLPDGPVPLGEYSPILWELFASQNIVAVRRGCDLRM